VLRSAVADDLVTTVRYGVQGLCPLSSQDPQVACSHCLNAATRGYLDGAQFVQDVIAVRHVSTCRAGMDDVGWHHRGMPVYQTTDPGDALDQHVRSFFAGHAVTHEQWPRGPMRQRVPDFFVYEVGPGPRWAGWTYVSSGCWQATQEDGYGLEFVLSADEKDARHVEIVTMAAYYHAGPLSDRLDLGHTVPIGQPWRAGSELDHLLVSLPYAYGPDLEIAEWTTGHARLLALMPITTAERNFKVEQGVEALEQRLEDQEASFSNPRRTSVV
jgi:hypothetical protein